jgi:hypothetical protein
MAAVLVSSSRSARDARPLGDLGVVEQGDVAVARVADDGPVQRVHLGAAALEHLDPTPV